MTLERSPVYDGLSFMLSNYLIATKVNGKSLFTIRNVGLLQEYTVNRILNDLVQLLQPISMVIEAEYKERSGIITKAIARYER